jgi:hypothetical protein
MEINRNSSLKQVRSCIGQSIEFYQHGLRRSGTLEAAGVDDEGDLMLIITNGEQFGAHYIIGTNHAKITPSATLEDRRAQLAAELEKVEAEIARDGLPEGSLWIPAYENSQERGPAAEDSTGLRIQWDDDDHRRVYIGRRPNSRSIDAQTLFAWVDRVRREND